MESLLPIPDSTTNMEGSQKHSYSHTDIHHHKSYSPDVEKPFDLSVSKCYSSFAGVEKNPSGFKFYEPSTELPSSVEAFPIDYSVRKRTREYEDFEWTQLTKRKKRETAECAVRCDYLADFPAQSFSDKLNSENKTRPAEGEQNNDSDIEIISWIRKDFNREDEKIDSYDGRSRKRKIHCKDLGQLQNIQHYSDCSDREVQLIMTNNLESEPPELIPINEIPGQFQEPESACRRIPASDYDCEFSCDCCGGSEDMNEGTPHSCGNCLSGSSSPAPPHSLLHAHRILMQKREKYLKSLEKARTINIERRYSNCCCSTVNTYCLCDGQIEIRLPSISVTPNFECGIFPDKTKTNHID